MFFCSRRHFLFILSFISFITMCCGLDCRELNCWGSDSEDYPGPGIEPGHMTLINKDHMHQPPCSSLVHLTCEFPNGTELTGTGFYCGCNIGLTAAHNFYYGFEDEGEIDYDFANKITCRIGNHGDDCQAIANITRYIVPNAYVDDAKENQKGRKTSTANHDYALFYIDYPSDDFLNFDVVTSTTDPRAESSIAYGYPGAEFEESDQHALYLYKLLLQKGQPWFNKMFFNNTLRYQNKLYAGMSGGPVVDYKDNKVIAICSSTIVEDKKDNNEKHLYSLGCRVTKEKLEIINLWKQGLLEDNRELIKDGDLTRLPVSISYNFESESDNEADGCTNDCDIQ